MEKFTPEALMEAARAWSQAEGFRMAARPSGVTRHTWREQHPINIPTSWRATLNGEPVTIGWDRGGGKPYLFHVVRPPNNGVEYGPEELPVIIERFDLRDEDAAERLSKYEPA